MTADEPLDLGNGLTGTTVSTLSELDQAAAEALARDEPVWSTPRWWRCAEQMQGYRIVYLRVSDAGGGLLALAPVMVAEGGRGVSFYNPLRMVGDFSALGDERLLDAAEQVEAQALRDELAGVGGTSAVLGMYGSHAGILVSPALPRDVALSKLLRLFLAVRERIEPDCSGLMYLDTADANALIAARDLGYERVLLGAEARLDLPPGSTFEDYVAAHSRNRRRKIRREIDAYRQAGLVTHVSRGPDALGEEIVPLYVALLARYGHAPDADQVRENLALLQRWMGDDLVVLTARAGPSVAGFVVCLHSGDTLYARTTGYDYERYGDAYCYFNLSYYDAIEWATRNGVRRIFYGLGTSEAKWGRGCELLPRWGLVRLGGPRPARAQRLLTLQHDSEVRRLATFGVDATLHAWEDAG